MSDSNTATVKPGGGYVENPDFEPNAGDMRKQFNTSGLGASGHIEETSAVFDLDKARTAEQIAKALDPDDASVSADKVLLPEGDVTPDKARKDILASAKARLKNPVVVGGPSPLEAAAGEDGDDNPTGKNAKATDGPRAEGGGTSTAPQAPAGSGSGSSTPASATEAGRTGKSQGSSSGTSDSDSTGSVKSGSGDDGDNGDGAPSGNGSRAEWASYAKDHGATDEEVAEDGDGSLSRNDLRDKYGPKKD